MRYHPSLFLAGAMLALSGCRTPLPSSFTYNHRLTTGIGHSILIEGVVTPIKFSEQSNSMARWSICHLRPEIVDVSDNQIVVTGHLKMFDQPDSEVMETNSAGPEKVRVFEMTDWKLKTPFRCISPDLTDITNPPKIEIRSDLQRGDFTSSKFFDPTLSAFDPSAHVAPSYK